MILEAEEQILWDKAAVEFAAALMSKPQDFTIQSAEHAVYEGINMAELFIKQRRLLLGK